MRDVPTERGAAPVVRVLVTGGAGFIGSHLVERLIRDHNEVAVLDNCSTGRLSQLDFAAREGQGRLQIFQGDVRTDASALFVHEYRPDIVMLLAAQSRVNVSMRDPRNDLETNVVGLVNIVEASRVAGVQRVIFASSGGTIYGSVAEGGEPAHEDTVKHPASFYGLTKLMGGEYLRLYWQNFGIDYVALALGNVYGPRQSPDGESGVIAAFAHQLALGEECTINGDGLTTRDYVHISDVVDAFMCAMNRGSGLINIGTGIETSVHEIYRMLTEQFDDARAPRYGPAMPQCR